MSFPIKFTIDSIKHDIQSLIAIMYQRRKYSTAFWTTMLGYTSVYYWVARFVDALSATDRIKFNYALCK